MKFSILQYMKGFILVSKRLRKAMAKKLSTSSLQMINIEERYTQL